HAIIEILAGGSLLAVVAFVAATSCRITPPRRWIRVCNDPRAVDERRAEPLAKLAPAYSFRRD
ncbi:MAG TPA: hypothetical protein VN289_07820, partial [Paraburkholderia sp.]|nr:hypothetical protein [Paraburkholderia sp.]